MTNELLLKTRYSKEFTTGNVGSDYKKLLEK